MKLLIVGLGSMGKRRARLTKGIDAAIQIVGVDTAESRRDEALRLGLADAAYATIGEAVNMSNNTVAKHVEGLVRKGMITTERTTVKTRDGRTHNGSLLYTLCPLAPVEQAYFEKQIQQASARMNFKAALEKYEKRKGGA